MYRKIQIAVPNIGTEEIDAIKEPLMSGWLTQGPKVKEFEQNFAKYHNINYAIITTSCTTALRLCLLALGIKEGDEVIIPSFTWVATANCILYCNAKPILVDVEKDTYNISIDAIRKAITKKQRLLFQCIYLVYALI